MDIHEACEKDIFRIDDFANAANRCAATGLMALNCMNSWIPHFTISWNKNEFKKG